MTDPSPATGNHSWQLTGHTDPQVGADGSNVYTCPVCGQTDRPRPSRPCRRPTRSRSLHPSRTVRTEAVGPPPRSRPGRPRKLPSKPHLPRADIESAPTVECRLVNVGAASAICATQAMLPYVFRKAAGRACPAPTAIFLHAKSSKRKRFPCPKLPPTRAPKTAP